MSERPILLQADHLKKWFPVRKGVFSKAAQYVKAVDDVSLVIREGETLGIVGESGCGKSTLARTMMRLIEPTEGTVLFQGQDLTSADKESLRRMRRDIQIIFQDPYASLNPRQRVSDILAEPFLIHKLGSREAAMKRAEELLDLVGLSQDSMRKFPHEFSGGQRQRLCIARALSVSPKLIVCDECVSALDVSIQAQIINLLMHLQQKLGIALVFVSHDLRVVQHISTHVAVMYLGKVVEYAEKQELFAHPTHPYTQALLSAVPLPDPTRQPERIILQGDLPSPIAVPSGCPFHPRCFAAWQSVPLPSRKPGTSRRTDISAAPAVRTVSVLRRYFCMNSQYQHAYCQVSGTPFEQASSRGRSSLMPSAATWLPSTGSWEQEKVDLQAYQAFVNQNLRFFQEQRPEMYEELQGIAQGSGLPLDDILLLNIPAYFLCESFRHITQECSMLCVRGQAAADGCTYIIKNRDMGMPMEQALVRHIYPDGQEIIEVGGAGILTYPAVGINSHGLAVTTTGFWTEKDPPASTG